MTEVKFTADKVTKNAVRFTETAEEGRTPTMGTVYLQKSEIKKQGVEDPDTAKHLELEIKSVST